MNKTIRRVCAILCVLVMMLQAWGVSASTHEIDLNIASVTTGNVFFDGDIPTVQVLLKNYNLNTQSYNLVYEVQKRKLDGAWETVHTEDATETLSGGASIKQKFQYDAPEYGTYQLKVSAFHQEGQELQSCTTEFSKVIKNDTANPRHGICVHLVRMGDADTELSFAKNAGFGMVRDDFSWSEYETVKGQKELSDRQKKLLQKAGQYDLDVLAIVGGGNELYETTDRDYGLPTDMAGFSAFVESLIQEDEFQTVKKIEVQNEPQRGYVANNGVQDLDSLVPTYGTQLITAAQIIREKRPDITIGAFSICLTGNEQTDDYITRTYEYLNENHQGETALFDTITIHPYTTYQGRTIGETVTYYKNIAKTQGFDMENTDIWCSEYGLPTGTTVSETAQAIRIIRDYADMKSQHFTDDVYIYDMADDGQTYGLVKHNVFAKVPYAAKTSYLAVSALNKLTGTATGCTKHEDEDGQFSVYEFSYPDEAVTVSMIYPAAQGEGGQNYSFGEGTLTYYDMVGNEITPEEGDAYFAANIPYYVAKNTRITPPETSGFTVSGVIDSKRKNKQVSLTVLGELTPFDENMQGKIQYADQQVTADGGSFRFRFDVDDRTENLVGYVVAEDASAPLRFELYGKIKALRLFSGATEIESLQLNLLNLRDAYVKVNFAGVREHPDQNLIAAFYDKDQLVYVKINQADGRDTYDISTNQEITYDTVKLFMFGSMTQCIPLCSATVIE